MRVAAIVLAGGSGTRLGSEINKVYAAIGGRSMLSYSLQTLAQAESVVRLVVVVRPEDRSLAALAAEQAGTTGRCRMVSGGDTRHDSEMAGLRAIGDEIRSGGVDLVAIHDGARPFASRALVDAVLDAARRAGGAIPGLPVPPGTHEVREDGAHALASGEAVRVQTPQAFAAGPLLEAYERATAEGFVGVDTAEVVERYGSLVIAVVPGDARNLKVTYAEDLARAAEMVMEWDAGRWIGER
jgi:2-C-methyl-D-erythritol 4-phosphate cytidylyltransferase